MMAIGIIFKLGYRYKKAGVTFIDLAPTGGVQSGLFDRPDDARSLQRMPAIDQLNARSGAAPSVLAQQASAVSRVFGGNSFRRAPPAAPLLSTGLRANICVSPSRSTPVTTSTRRPS